MSQEIIVALQVFLTGLGFMSGAAAICSFQADHADILAVVCSICSFALLAYFGGVLG